MDLCLVYMPFGSIEPPPLGVALLTASARREGLSTKAVYPSFDFAERMGYLKYNAVSMGLGGFQIAEWIFSAAAFPEMERDDDAFLRNYLEWERTQNEDKYNLFFSDEEAFLRVCRDARELVPAFIRDTGDLILDVGPRLVGCSSMYHQNCSSFALLRYLKKRQPELLTIMGGANCEVPMGKAMRNSFPFIDIVHSGEGDETFPELCRSLLENGLNGVNSETPAGAVTDSGEPSAVMVNDLSVLPVPDYDDYIDAREDFLYRSALAPLSLSMETSRGCWWGQKRQCTFCGVNGGRMKFRPKAPEQVRDELTHLADTYGCRTFMATDNILDMAFFKTLLRDLASDETPAWDFFFEVTSNLREKHVRLLSAAGVKRFQPGMESLHDGLLELLNKGNSAIGNVALLKYSYEQGVKVTWLVLVDVPGEDDSWYEETAAWLPLISHLQPPHRIKPIRYDRFSAYHRDPGTFGIELRPLRWYSDVYPLSEIELEDFAYHFERIDGSAADRIGPGRQKLEKVITSWMELHARSRSEGPPRLLAVREPGRTLITDSRPCAVAERIELTGLTDRIYRFCDAPVQTEELAGSVAAGCRDEFDEALEYLRENRLLLEMGGRILSLALRSPLQPFRYPPDYTFPDLQREMAEKDLSYWNLLENREEALRSNAFSDLWS
jgi:ribosomal peptide maturation radical SAM protein 1